MKDTLFINDLRLSCIIGVFEHERHAKQEVIINVKLGLDLKKAGQSDHIDDTVSYFEVAQDITKLVEQSSFSLIETLAENIANVCLKDKRIHEVTVHIEKPNAIPNAKSSAVEIVRSHE